MSIAVSRQSNRVAPALRGVFGLAAFGLALVAIVAILTVSGVSLDAFGWHYDTEGGPAVQKVHPGTLLLVLALGFRLLTRPTPRGVSDILLGEPGLVVALASVVAVVVYVAAFLQVPVTPPIDSYLLPVLVCLVLRGMSRHGLHVIACVVVAIFVLNDVVALYEYATGTRVFFVIPPDVTGHPEAIGSEVFDWKGHLAWDWRSSAMMGHPLDNALVTGAFVIVLQMRAAAWLSAWLRAFTILLSLAAMITFGGRVALLAVVTMSLMLWATRAGRALLASRRISLRALAATFALVPVAAGGAALALETGVLDRFLERFVSDDGSAETRVLMWRLFEPLSGFDVLVGPDQDIVKLHQRLQGLELGIESFLAGLPLGYGLVVTAFVMTGWIGLFAFMAKATARQSWLPVLTFMIIGATSAGLASKTVALGAIAAVVMVVLSRPSARREPNQRPAPSPRYPPTGSLARAYARRAAAE